MCGVCPARPVSTWPGMAVVLQSCAQLVSSSRRWVSVPYFIVGGIATMTGMLGSHRYSILVGAPLMLFALVSLTIRRQVASQRGITLVRPSFPVWMYMLDYLNEVITCLV